MNKKLLAVAVAGALAAPTVAFAQSSVTISGMFHVSIQGFKISNALPARDGGNKSETLLHDNSSRIIFNVTEDLGAGLSAIAQLDWRVVPDNSGGSNSVSGGATIPGLPTDSVSGNNHIGLRSKQWGRLLLGMQDVHYFGRESDLTVKNDLQADSISLLAYAGGAGMASFSAASQGTGGAGAIAGATRTRNIVHYTTPNWGGFSGIIAYSFNPTLNENDMNTGAATNASRKGYAWNVAPTFEARNFTVGYSYWSQKSDNNVTQSVFVGAGNQRGDRLFGSYRWGGFRIGAAWDRSKITSDNSALTGLPVMPAIFVSGNTLAKRDAWSIPVEYSWGPHWIGGHYTKANNDKATTCATITAAACTAGLDRDGAKMYAIGYNYSLSKRTSVGLTYAQIKNDPGAIYALFTSGGALGAAGHLPGSGEDPKMWSMSLRHTF